MCFTLIFITYFEILKPFISYSIKLSDVCYQQLILGFDEAYSENSSLHRLNVWSAFQFLFSLTVDQLILLNIFRVGIKVIDGFLEEQTNQFSIKKENLVKINVMLLWKKIKLKEKFYLNLLLLVNHKKLSSKHNRIRLNMNRKQKFWWNHSKQNANVNFSPNIK